MQKYRICYSCGEKMYPCIKQASYVYNGHRVTIDDVQVFKCENCNEEILESHEAKRVEDIVVIKTNN